MDLSGGVLILRTVFVAALLFVVIPVALPTGNATCEPTRHPTTVDAEHAVYVASFADERDHRLKTGVFAETNNLVGLQTSRTEACGANADTLLVAPCGSVSTRIPGFNVLCLVEID